MPDTLVGCGVPRGLTMTVPGLMVASLILMYGPDGLRR